MNGFIRCAACVPAGKVGDISWNLDKLLSLSQPEQRYIGHTADLRERLKKHNKGDVPHTAKFRPWKVETYMAFESEEKSIAFEHYLKSGSGHAFAKRHF